MSIIAIPNASPDFTTNAAAGVITYWRLQGTVEHRLVNELAELYALPAPRQVGESTALKRAMELYTTTRQHMMKPLTASAGFTVLTKLDEQDAAQRWKSSWSAYMDAGVLVVQDIDGNAPSSSTLTETMITAMETMQSVDVSSWIVSAVEHHQAVSLRESGGFYFVPGKHAERWDAVARALEKFSNHKVHAIPAMSGEQATLSVLAGLTDEVATSTQRMQEALDEARLGKRALNTKIDACGMMLEKIGTYEELLGRRLESLRDSVDTLKAKCVEAVLVEERGNDQRAR